MAIRISTNEPKPAAEPRKAKPAHIPSGKAGRPASGKIVVSIRLEPAVVAKFRATGPGWQARMNDALKAARV